MLIHCCKNEMFQDEIKGFYVLNLPGLQPGLIDSGRFIVHQEGTQRQMCSASRKHSMMKNPNCSILKRMDTASSCLQGRRLTRWRTDSTLNSYWRLYVCFLSRQRKPLIPSPVFIKQARKLGRCDSNLQNLKTLLTH